MCLAVPGRLTRIIHEDSMRLGEVEFDGIIIRACLELVPEAEVGEFVLVHAGMVLQTVDEEEAEKTLELIRQLEKAGKDERE
jgi:hydrogenase expression/formation protein HypC